MSDFFNFDFDSHFDFESDSDSDLTEFIRERESYSSDKCLNDVIFVKPLGMVPVNVFFEAIKVSSNFKLQILLGIVPLKKFELR